MEREHSLITGSLFPQSSVTATDRFMTLLDNNYLRLSLVLVISGFLFSACNSQTVTYSEYQDVKNGMTYEEVVEIVGEEGKEMSNIDAQGVGNAQGISAKGYKWQNSDGSNMIVSFVNGEVATKAQAMLN